ncbi:DUF167 domain-containing protein [Candidatus Woesearchaeota archaeon]|jgi:uncharacterized protein (TIGR00251 family)|nr:DUF167 domain-containing protein [Candidatus Woesearchaeota archaeon]
MAITECEQFSANTVIEKLKNQRVKIIVKPNAPKTKILFWDSQKQAFKIAVAAVPDKDRANTAIIKFFSKLLKCKVTIISGLKSREKIIQI